MEYFSSLDLFSLPPSVLKEAPPSVFSWVNSKSRFKLLIGKNQQSIKVIAFLFFEEDLPYMEVERVSFFGETLKQEEEKALVKKIEEEACKENIEWIGIKIEEEKNFSLSLRKTLFCNGYSIPSSPYLEIEEFSLETFSPPWFFQKYPLKKGYEIKKWGELSPQQEATLKRRVESGNIPEFISPFQAASYVQPLNSLFLETSGDVIGWLVTHTYPGSAQTIDYTAFFLEREFRAQGLAQKLLQKALQIQFSEGKNLGINKMRFEVNYARSPKSWICFLFENLKPFSTKVLYVFLTKKKPFPSSLKK